MSSASTSTARCDWNRHDVQELHGLPSRAGPRRRRQRQPDVARAVPGAGGTHRSGAADQLDRSTTSTTSPTTVATTTHPAPGTGMHDVITGDSSNNALSGLGGNDTLIGGAATIPSTAAGDDPLTDEAGNDSYIVGNVGDMGTDTFVEAASRRHRHGEGLRSHLHAGDQCREPGADRQRQHQRHRQQWLGQQDHRQHRRQQALLGLNGNDTLDGGSGNDTLVGGFGRRARRQRRGRSCRLANCACTDTVRSSIDFFLCWALTDREPGAHGRGRYRRRPATGSRQYDHRQLRQQSCSMGLPEPMGC